MPLLKLLYNFMGFPYDLKNINSTLGDQKNHGRHQYYSLNRDINFDPNHWKQELNKDVSKMSPKTAWLNPHQKILLQRLSEVERLCGEVIQELGYPLLT